MLGSRGSNAVALFILLGALFAQFGCASTDGARVRRKNKVASEEGLSDLEHKQVANLLFMTTSGDCGRDEAIFFSCGGARIDTEHGDDTGKGVYVTDAHCFYGNWNQLVPQRVWITRDNATMRGILPQRVRGCQSQGASAKIINDAEAAVQAQAADAHELLLDETHLFSPDWQGFHISGVAKDIALIIDDVPFEDHEALQVAKTLDLGPTAQLLSVGVDNCLDGWPVSTDGMGEAFEWRVVGAGSENYTNQRFVGNLIAPSREFSFSERIPAFFQSYNWFQWKSRMLLDVSSGNSFFVELEEDNVPCPGSSGAPWLTPNDKVLGLNSLNDFIWFSDDYEALIDDIAAFLDGKPFDTPFPQELYNRAAEAEKTRRSITLGARTNSDQACALFRGAQVAGKIAGIPSACVSVL